MFMESGGNSMINLNFIRIYFREDNSIKLADLSECIAETIDRKKWGSFWAPPLKKDITSQT